MRFGLGDGEDVGIEGVEEGAGFGEDVFGFGAGEGPAEDALRGELGSAFGVAADEAHEVAGVDAVAGERSRSSAIGEG